MSLQTRITALAQAVATDVKAIFTALSGKVDSTDARLGNAREWSAETISQAEAEAGTATTRRAWTAQRVRQAASKAYEAVTSVFGRGLANATNAAAGRTALELGTAATSNVTTSATDTTANAILKFGDFGLGSAVHIVSGTDLNTITRPGFYQHQGGTPVNGPTAVGAIFLQCMGRPDFPVQIAVSFAGQQMWIRSCSAANTFGPWRLLVTEDRSFSGTYTPTLSNILNASSSSAFSCHYMRVDNTVTVAGRINITSAAAGDTQVGISLPVPSNFGGASGANCGGVGTWGGLAMDIYADSTADYAIIRATVPSAASVATRFSFTYIIQ